MTTVFHPGQRWISETEPELGLGAVERVSPLTVTLAYRASGQRREYARDNAPLRRVRFHPGDRVRDRANSGFTVRAVREEGGLYLYRGAECEVPESELSDAITFSTPRDRLFAGQGDPPDLFDLRAQALRVQNLRRKSEVRGFAGGRIDLIPHQLYIASEVARRLVPRVLLADEVGLGKTIEAGLILHRLLLTGRARRVLILAPDSLVHQWLVEMLRRFNLWFHIYDEARCAAIEAATPERNPFLEDQLVLASLRLFTGSNRRVEQAREAGFDLLVVDEAHHLGWSPRGASPEYRVVETLSLAAPGLLLLTATPEQLGMASHFARLRLLDPARFHDLDLFLREASGYLEVARTALGLDDEEARNDLLDQHGTGRVMFRNTRATITGFPKRTARLCPLSPEPTPSSVLERLREEFRTDANPDLAARASTDFSEDPRIPWLVDLLRSLDPAKVLLICRTRAKAEAIEAAMRGRLNVKVALFHEGLSLVQRDRHAAWFSEPDGARLLVASEIGSEGRNFQFAHHLVLFDLPAEPEILEQRIGRLDRIGQAAEITLHIPFLPQSPQEVLARWYHSGLNAFEQNLHGGHELFELLGEKVRALTSGPGAASDEAIAALIASTVAARVEVSHRLEEGRDRLLEMNSFRPRPAERLAELIRAWDRDLSLDDFMMKVLDHFMVPVEALAPRTYRLGSAGVLVDEFPGLPASGLSLTCERARALSREDLQFLTWDHPLVSGALDLILGSERGNACFARWSGGSKAGLELESLFVLECVAPPHLHADRFLPPTPLRIVVDQQGEAAAAAEPPSASGPALIRGNASLVEHEEVRESLLPGLMEIAETLARQRGAALIAEARREMNAQLDHEIARLRALQKVNRSVRAEEIDLLIQEKAALDQHLAGARVRLDAIRLIHGGEGP